MMEKREEEDEKEHKPTLVLGVFSCIFFWQGVTLVAPSPQPPPPQHHPPSAALNPNSNPQLPSVFPTYMKL